MRNDIEYGIPQEWLVKQRLYEGGPVSRNLFQLVHSRPVLGGKRLLPLLTQMPGTFSDHNEHSPEPHIMGAGPPAGTTESAGCAGMGPLLKLQNVLLARKLLINFYGVPRVGHDRAD